MNRSKIAFYLAYAIGLLLFIEVVLRVCFPIPEIANFNRTAYQVLNNVEEKGAYLRNTELLWKSTPDTNHTFVHRLNNYGFRDPKDWKIKKSKQKRILFTGDSFVEGLMSSEEQTIPKGFENTAKSQANQIEWFNCGMMGIGLNKYLSFLVDAVPIFKPDEVFLILYANDPPFQEQYKVRKSLPPIKYSFWTPRLKVLIEHILKHDPIPFSFTRKQSPFFKGIPDPANPWTKHEEKLINHVTPVIAKAMKKGDYNYYRTNWILKEETFLKRDVELKSKISYLKDFLSSFNCDLKLFYIPSRSQVNTSYYYPFEKKSCTRLCPDSLNMEGVQYQKHAKLLKENCQELGIPFLDLTPRIKAEEKNGNHLYWNYDEHMRGKGYMLIGQEIFNFWNKNNSN